MRKAITREKLDSLYQQVNLGRDEPGEMIMNGHHLKYMARKCWGSDEGLKDMEGNPISDMVVYMISERGICAMDIPE